LQPRTRRLADRLPSEGTGFPLYELFMNQLLANKFNCSAVPRRRGSAPTPLDLPTNGRARLVMMMMCETEKISHSREPGIIAAIRILLREKA